MEKIGGFTQRFIHPIASDDEKQINERISKLPNYVKGAEVLHEFDRQTNSVSWFLRVPSGLSEAEEAALIDAMNTLCDDVLK